MDRKNPVTEHALLRVSDGESLGWLSASQYDELRTLRLLTPKFEWKGTMPINLNKFNLPEQSGRSRPTAHYRPWYRKQVPCPCGVCDPSHAQKARSNDGGGDN